MTDWGIVAARFLQYGPALFLFGAPFFSLYRFDGHAASPSHSVVWLNTAYLMAGILAFAGAVWWVLAETASIFSDPGQFGAGAVWTVLTGTGFGRGAFLRIVILAACIAGTLLLPSGRAARRTQVIFGGVIVASFAWTGHGIEGEGFAGLIHLGADVVHLLAAAIWIGALVSLAGVILHSIRVRADEEAEFAWHALKSFSGIGTAVIALLILSGLINSWFLVGLRHLPQLVTTAYGRLLLVKLGLFAAMIALAAMNRFRFNPQLGSAVRDGGAGTEALQSLRNSVLTETGLGVLVLFVVSWMGTLEPPMSGG